jgi:spore coat protein CotF
MIWKKEASKKITYNNLEMIKPEMREELIRQLEEQTGMKIQRIKIERVNLLTNSAIIRIYYIDI